MTKRRVRLGAEALGLLVLMVLSFLHTFGMLPPWAVWLVALAWSMAILYALVTS